MILGPWYHLQSILFLLHDEFVELYLLCHDLCVQSLHHFLALLIESLQSGEVSLYVLISIIALSIPRFGKHILGHLYHLLIDDLHLVYVLILSYRSWLSLSLIRNYRFKASLWYLCESHPRLLLSPRHRPLFLLPVREDRLFPFFLEAVGVSGPQGNLVSQAVTSGLQAKLMVL